MKRKPTLFESISCFVVLAIVIGAGFGYFEIPIQPLLLISAAYAAFIAHRVGLTWEDMEKGIVTRLNTAMPAIFIIFAVGVIVGTWIYSGTVPMLINYGLLIIDPRYFLVTAFIITAIVSVATGTAWGSSATAGVALMGIAVEMNLPLGITAGAIISGAIFGDKLSPLSDTTNLAPLVVGVDLYDHIKHMLWTTIPATIVGMIVWFVVGLGFEPDSTSGDSVGGLTAELSSIFNWNIFMLLPFVIILWGAFAKKPIVPIMLLSSVVAVFIGVFSNGFSFVDGITSMANGFSVDMVASNSDFSETVNSLLNRGGIFSMVTIVVTIFCGYAFAGIVEAAGCLDRILEAFTKMVQSTWQIIGSTIIGSILIVFTAGVASISIIMVGVLMKDAYVKKGLDPLNLSRTLEDAGTMILGFVPWGVSAIYYLEVLGVGVGDYWMWAVPCYLCIVFAMIYAITGIGIKKIDPEESK
ncbi:Na+/H+ antiporter NhaC [Jeotgalicoccus meleagridis]|jgi:NhaC family Na+:H+ antiporter|uniref:Malate-2H(+)/Na(+)-lactate antiporter n=1 Tax=Jeotgalicoccus meleagridis TaxID=2759181 RepID=A0A6V7R493_9STAP|nr:Na+/H+ antiporter NhaC [Jeotgalicoccus meleagridis]CAD2071863.1 Malate-2H(+)/Na(+)-lactate antiporter [Jeotgalicoccus meleagridis]